MRLPNENNLVEIERDGERITAVVDEVEREQCASRCPRIRLSVSVPMQKSDTCFWIDGDGTRCPVTIEDVMTDWGLTTVNLRLQMIA